MQTNDMVINLSIMSLAKEKKDLKIRSISTFYKNDPTSRTCKSIQNIWYTETQLIMNSLDKAGNCTEFIT